MTPPRDRSRRSGPRRRPAALSPVEEMLAQVGPDFYDDAAMRGALTGQAADPAPDLPSLREVQGVLALQSFDGHWIYPTWQVRDQRLVPGLAEVLVAFAGHPAWSVATWLTTPTADLDDRAPVAVLDDEPARVLHEAQLTAIRWAA